MWGATSPDGVRWTVLPGPLVIHFSDTTNVVYFDLRLQRYVWYARCSAFGRRCIGRAETDDWYTNSKTVYPSTVDQHLMFPALYHHRDDTSELRLFSSSDGIIWSEAPGPPALSPAPKDSWDAGCVFGGTDLIPLGTGRVALPYGGYRYPHKYPRNRHTFSHDLGYAVWPAERLAGIEAEQEGSFMTLRMVAKGRRLRLNARIEKAGYILVEAADRTGHPLPGHNFAEAIPMLGDSPNHRVTWRTGEKLNLDPARPFILRFRFRAAKLFAFELD